jgi:hypothetical protein
VAVAERQVSVEFVFDRTGDRALALAYRVLVPERRARAMQRRDADEHCQAPAAEEGEHRCLGA